jgi:hypothetical protein
MNFKEWLKINEVGTMSSTITGGVGDVAPFKSRLFGGLIRRTWPYLNYKQDKNKKK